MPCYRRARAQTPLNYLLPELKSPPSAQSLMSPRRVTPCVCLLVRAFAEAWSTNGNPVTAFCSPEPVHCQHLYTPCQQVSRLFGGSRSDR